MFLIFDGKLALTANDKEQGVVTKGLFQEAAALQLDNEYAVTAKALKTTLYFRLKSTTLTEALTESLSQ